MPRYPASPYTGSNGMASHSMAGDDSAMPETRLKIYSDLFEEVIERDRVFGSLLRKIKTAYDMLLLRGHEQEAMQSAYHKGQPYGFPPQGTWPHEASPGEGRPYGGPPSNEPTTRAEQGGEGWEMHRENRVLKDLVERLHLELEEAVKREHRWKQKVVKLKSRVESANNSQIGAQQAFAHGGPAAGFPTGFNEDPWPPYQQGVAPMEQQVSMEQQAFMAQQMAQQMAAQSAAAQRTFHSLHREPGPRDIIIEAQEVALNQGGLLSMSSISPQTSALPAQESAVDCAAASGPDTPGSQDSGRLPQRPDRRQVIRPAHVPPLDLTRLKHQLEEEEEEEEEREGDEILEGADMDGEALDDEDGMDGGEMSDGNGGYHHHQHQHQHHHHHDYMPEGASGSEEGYSPHEHGGHSPDFAGADYQD